MTKNIPEIVSSFDLNKILAEIGFQKKQSIIDLNSDVQLKPNFNDMAIYEYCAKLSVLLLQDFDLMKDAGFKIRYHDALCMDLMKSIGFTIENDICRIQSKPKQEDLEIVIKTHLWHKINVLKLEYNDSPFSNSACVNYDTVNKAQESTNQSSSHHGDLSVFYEEQNNEHKKSSIYSPTNNRNDDSVDSKDVDSEDDFLLSLLEPPIDDQPIKTDKLAGKKINSQDQVNEELSYNHVILSNDSLGKLKPQNEKACVDSDLSVKTVLNDGNNESTSISFERINKSEIDISPLVNINSSVNTVSNIIISKIYPDLSCCSPSNPYVKSWICEQCQNINNGGYKCVSCEIVNMDRQKNLSLRYKKEVRDLDQVLYENEKSWTCQSCHYKNVHGFRCVSCNKFDKQARERHDSDTIFDDLYWVCRKCKTQNSIHNKECSNCQCTLPYTEVYFCRTCSYMNNVSNINCGVCNSTNKTHKYLTKCIKCAGKYVNSKYEKICLHCLIKKHGDWVCKGCDNEVKNSKSEIFCRNCGQSKV